MEFRGMEVDDAGVAETPEDVAVLYSWANLHGAKYRDFSASRREYRAQLRHRAAEQVREKTLPVQAEPETAACVAENAASEAVRKLRPEESDSPAERSLCAADEALRTAAAERVEAARRAETAAFAEAAARREEREIAEAHASAQTQAARFANSEIRRRAITGNQRDSAELPGQVIDPSIIYSNVPSTEPFAVPSHIPMERAPMMKPLDRTPQESVLSNNGRNDARQAGETSSSLQEEQRGVIPQQDMPRRPQGYRPDDASGVRQIYRGPDYDASAVGNTPRNPSRDIAQGHLRRVPAGDNNQEIRQFNEEPAAPSRTSAAVNSGVPSDLNPNPGQQTAPFGQRRTDVTPGPGVRPQKGEDIASSETRQRNWSAKPGDHLDSADSNAGAGSFSNGMPLSRSLGNLRLAPLVSTEHLPVSPFSHAPVPSDSIRGRRAQDDLDHEKPQGFPEPSRRNVPEAPPTVDSVSSQRTAYPSDTGGPAWLYAPPAPHDTQRPAAQPVPVAQSSVADTLQHSRERVAARWYALKGVFEQPGQEPEAAPVRQKETRTPVLAVFSLAGGVGKTSLVATVGRSLSSMGEKVLLTDTTSHGLLPFYFGASELRQGTVRTFSPPSGSTDAPIYLVSYDVEQKAGDEEAQESLAEEIINHGRGTHRILLDLTVRSSWIVRHISRMNPTILVPVAPDMNSVISLQTVERFFSGISDGDGRPLQPFYVLNQFDPSLPLHLDVREVMRRQLGDRLLPFVIRRAPAVSEALAEGMTVIDYAPDAAVAEDYLNLAIWLRTVAAPATSGFRNVRWSEG